MNIIELFIVCIGKIIDNLLGTTKTLLIQKNKALLASICIGVSNIIYMSITKKVATSANGTLLLLVSSLGACLGCYFALLIDAKFSKDKTYINILLSDDRETMEKLRDFLAEHHIVNVATDTYTRDWQKTISITAYAETKEESRLIDEYIAEQNTKIKRIIDKKA